MNANGPTLKTKQLFHFESDGQGRYAFASHKKKYLTADNKTVLCNAAAKGQKEWFTISYNVGVVYIRNWENKFLSVDANGNLTCKKKTNNNFLNNNIHEIKSNTKQHLNPNQTVATSASTNEEWEIILNVHPQICLSTAKRYLAVEKGDAVSSTRPTQFGRETTLTMVPVPGFRGVYSFMGTNYKYFSADPSGNITCNGTDLNSASTHFVLEFWANCLAIRSLSCNKYLSASGNGIKATRAAVAAKEIFLLVDSDAQVTLKASNNKFVAFQLGNLISVPKMGDKGEEIFMLEFDNGKWAFRTVSEMYLTCQDNVVSVSSKTRGPSELFEFVFENGKVAMKASNGKFLQAKPLGGIDAKSASVTPSELFEIYFYNRREIVFQTNMATFIGVTNDKVCCFQKQDKH